MGGNLKKNLVQELQSAQGALQTSKQLRKHKRAVFRGGVFLAKMPLCQLAVETKTKLRSGSSAEIVTRMFKYLQQQHVKYWLVIITSPEFISYQVDINVIHKPRYWVSVTRPAVTENSAMMLANLTNWKRKRAKETKNKEVHRKRKKGKRLSKKGGKKRHKGLRARSFKNYVRNYATNAMSLSSLSRIEVENRHFHIPHSDTTIICTSLVHPRTGDRILQLDSV